MSKFIDRTGEKRMMNCGMEAEIIIYRNSRDIDVKFTDGIIIQHKAYKNFLDGYIKNPYYNKYIGETNIMTNGLQATIIRYRKNIDIDIQFEDNIGYSNFSVG